ncbi:MAG: nitroreductase family protein [Bryobacterales bacterium]|nr:nitroreductase family protein [Bryobacteraceae bacterium]MDW8128917.1 nitroreductase family protein [Bryobacterales bacterium]
MDAIEALKTRRSVRDFRAGEVPASLLEELVDCARLAPSGRNEQPWEFVVVRDRQKLRELAALTDNGRFIADAAACIVVVCRPAKYFLEDGSAATQNILLAAHAHGLGACWVAGDKKPYATSVLKAVGAPEGYHLVSLVPVGWAAAELPERAPKRSLAEVLHWERF